MKKIKKYYIIEPLGFKKMDIQVIKTDYGYGCIFENLNFINHFNVRFFKVHITNDFCYFYCNNYINEQMNFINQSDLHEILNNNILQKIWNCIKIKLNFPDYIIEINTNQIARIC